MQINWLIITYFVVGFFAISGLSRGWWKEALTTVFLAMLVFLLQQPDVAQGAIAVLNSLLIAIWSFIPLSVHGMLNDLIFTLFAIDTGGTALQFDPTSSGTWLMILAIVILFSITLGRSWLTQPPTRQGGWLGFLIGGVNGFLILSLAREYLDGRSLPGTEVQASNIVIEGNSGFGSAASALSIQATNLPSFTILDSVIPWIIMAAGLLFLFSIFKTRFRILTNQHGMRKLDYQKLPPLYANPPSRKISFQDAWDTIYGSDKK